MIEDAVVKLDPKLAKVVNLVWYEGNPYDYCGYYVTVEFNGNRHQMFLEYAGRPEEEDKE